MNRFDIIRGRTLEKLSRVICRKCYIKAHPGESDTAMKAFDDFTKSDWESGRMECPNRVFVKIRLQVMKRVKKSVEKDDWVAIKRVLWKSRVLNQNAYVSKDPPEWCPYKKAHKMKQNVDFRFIPV